MHFAPDTAKAPSTLAIAAAVAAVLGHVFPVWLRFSGGKGIATALGVFIALVPLVALCSARRLRPHRRHHAPRLARLHPRRRLHPVSCLLWCPTAPPLFVGLSFISLLSIVKHHANIVRLLHGTESRFGSKKSPDSRPDKKVNA